MQHQARYNIPNHPTSKSTGGPAEFRSWRLLTASLRKLHSALDIFLSVDESSSSFSISRLTTMPQPARFLPRRAVRAVLPLRLSNRNPRAHFLCEHQIFSLTARQFTTTRHRDAAMGGLRDVNYNSVMPKVHSSKTQMAKQTAGKERSMPDDLGRMPNSLVMAPSSNLPSWLPPTSSRRLRLKWFQLKTAVQSWFRYERAPLEAFRNRH